MKSHFTSHFYSKLQDFDNAPDGINKKSKLEEQFLVYCSMSSFDNVN